MLAYRLASHRFANDLTGTGAAIHGGRWNRKGVPVLYCSESKEIALLEWLVNATADIVPKLKLVTLQFPDESIWKLPKSKLPEEGLNRNGIKLKE